MPTHNDYPAITSASPVNPIQPDSKPKKLEKGVVLCLSGGGYRAMLFHVGAIWRLNEAGLLPKINRVSSVSGGSITAGVLGVNWQSLRFNDHDVAENLKVQFVNPVYDLASKTLDVPAGIKGFLLPGSIPQKIANAYDKHLFNGATLQALPSDEAGPRFVFNATNLQSGALWRFSKPYIADYLVGRIFASSMLLAKAVAASSAFPPFLSPLKLNFEPGEFRPDPQCPLQKEPYTSRVLLSDGGVYDNLGLETAWKRYTTVLVSDAGGKMAYETRPKRFWPLQAIRVLNVIDNQVRSLRKRQLIDSYTMPEGNIDHRSGAYWGIRTDIKNYELPYTLPCPEKLTLKLADISTRLKKMDEKTRQMLINWGYAVCDAALRKHCTSVFGQIEKPAGFPYPVGVGE